MNPSKQEKIKGWVYFGVFAFLITLGILFKRIWGHRELLWVCHLAALYFVVGWYRRIFS